MSQQPASPDRWRQRIRPIDPTTRLPLKRLIPLVLVETAGMAILFGIYKLLDMGQTPLAPLIVPPLVSFALVFATAHSPASRPLRVIAAYVIAGFFGLGMACFPGSRLLNSVIAALLTLLVMHATGAFHAPAVAVSMAAVLTEADWHVAVPAYPLLVATAIVAVFLAWSAHKILGDDTYPDKWW
jgi:CBS-domain-containing membrane protein